VTDPLFAELEAELRRQDGLAERFKDRRQVFALSVLALSLLAALCASIQGTWFHEPSFSGILLAIVEVALLVTLLIVELMHEAEAHHHEWVDARLRAELLRRERFLYFARVGPYLKSSESELGPAVAERLSRIRAENGLELIPPMGGAATWQEELEDARHESRPELNPASPDGRDPRRYYLEERLLHQKRYFSTKAEEHLAWDRSTRSLIKLVVVVAVLAAAGHSIGLILHSQEAWAQGLVFGARFLPALSVGVLAWREMSQSQRLHLGFRRKHWTLGRLERQIERFEISYSPFQFKRFVLQTEIELSHDLYEWWLVMGPAAPEVAHR
jgi:hypothetical protein